MYDIQKFRENDICITFNNEEEIDVFLNECRENGLVLASNNLSFINAVMEYNKVLACGFAEYNKVKFSDESFYKMYKWECINIKELRIADITPSKIDLMEFLDI